jgi:hypothetical protein
MPGIRRIFLLIITPFLNGGIGFKEPGVNLSVDRGSLLLPPLAFIAGGRLLSRRLSSRDGKRQRTLVLCVELFVRHEQKILLLAELKGGSATHLECVF